MLNKNLAGFFAFFLGIFGVHRFYLGQWWRGALQFAGFWALVFLNAETNGDGPFPFMMAGIVLAPMITALVFWATPKRKWQEKYDKDALLEGEQPLGIAGPSQRGTKSLKAEGVRYYRSGDYDLAIEAFLEGMEVDPTDPGVHFNLACSYAQLGQYADTLRHLEMSITFGLPKPERIEKHPALKALRNHSSYRQFRANNYRRLNLVEITEVQEKAQREQPEEVLEDFENPPPRHHLTPGPKPAPKSIPIQDASPAEADTPPAGPDLLEQITRLKELHDAGILTEAEFQKQKEKILG
ncbi:NINE protein [Lewinella sp. W8]|uniref:NINE protein n=1 Tax=Lewinella sp. W8 TaxID=2528208 RepID=UPI001563D892|nr:NINE protein [Lewinella sp. W8]